MEDGYGGNGERGEPGEGVDERKEVEDEVKDVDEKMEDVAQDDEAGDEVVGGETTPPPSITNEDEDELLAWTLGGDLKLTLSPGSAWAPTPQKDGKVPTEGSEEWINQKIAELEILCLQLSCYCC